MGESLSNDIDFSRVRTVFETAAELNEQILDQNYRLEEAPRRLQALEEELKEENDELEMLEFLDLIEQGIAEEQQETFLELAEIGQGSGGQLYERIGVLALSVEEEKQESKQAIADLEAESEEKDREFDALVAELKDAERIKYERLLAEVERLSPKALDGAQDLIGRRLEALPLPPEAVALEEVMLGLYGKIEEKKRHLDELGAVSEEVQELHEQGGKEWAIPQALLKVLGDNVQDWITIDELPVEPQLSPSGHQRYAELRSRHSPTPEASVYAAYHLISNVEKTTTVEEIADFLYSAEVRASISEARKRSLVTTLLGPTKTMVGNLLAEEGYALQYGWRRMFERGPDGQIKLKNKHRIYRAISLTDPGIAEETGRAEEAPIEEGPKDEFEPIPGLEELATHWQETHPDDSQESESETPAGSGITAKERAVPLWIRELKVEFGQALSELEKLGLLAEREGVTLKHAKGAVPSRIYGTTETINILKEAGLMKTFKGDPKQWPDAIVTPEEMVAMLLFNPHHVFSKARGRDRQRKAITALTKAVEAYFEHRQNS